MHHIIQITDLHLTETPMDEFRGVNPRKQLERILKTPDIQQCDLILVTGDIAIENSEPGAYRDLKIMMDGLNKPYHVLPGNHDGAEELARAFGLNLSGGTLNRVIDDPVPLIFMDSSSEQVEESDLEFLRSALRRYKGKSPLLFIHHPLIDCAHPIMDSKYFLRGREKIRRVLEESGVVKHVFSGHCHKTYSETLFGISHHVTPSTAVEFVSNGDIIINGHQNPGFREIKVDLKSGQVKSRTIYLS